MFKYEFHPLASSLPLMREPDFTEFCQDIKQNGQFLPIGIFEGKILDGRNRYNACKKLGIEGKFEKVSPKDAKAYVTSINVHRRQLTREERQHHLMLLIAKQDTLEMTNSEVAKAAKVSESTVVRKKRETSKRTVKTPVLTPLSAKNGEKQVKSPILDSARYPVPVETMAYWNRKSEVQEILTHISKAKSIIGKIADGDPLYRRISSVQRTWKELESLYNEYKGVLPSYVCPICDGVKVDGCKACVGTGVISEYVWGNLTPEQRAKRGMEQPF